METLQDDTSPLSQRDVLDIDTSLSRRTFFVPKPIPATLEPLSISDLYNHVCSILTFNTTNGWQMPGASDHVTYTPPKLIIQPEESQQYLKCFLDYFINVKNFVKFEKIFRENLDTSDLTITHLLSFAWTLLDHGSLKFISIDTKGLFAEDFLIIVMKFLRIFSRLDNLACSIGQKHGIKLLLRAMLAYPFCIQLQINCSATLANLASAETNRTTMLEDGCIKLVLNNMEKFIDQPAVLAEICATLANLAAHDANGLYIVRNGGCGMIIKALRKHRDKIDFQIQAFHALASLGKNAREILDRENFISIVINCIEFHQDEVDLVSATWHALGSLANSGISISHKSQLLSMIFSSMRRFSENYKFQITACFALAHVFFNRSNEKFILGEPHEDDQAVSSQQGIECLLDTIRRFPEQESLQTTALFALGSIVMKSPAHRDTVLKSNGIPLIIDAMGRKYNMNVSKDSSDNWDQGDEAQAPEPILYSRGNNRVQCSKPLLLQLFGSVTLLNLSECNKCRDKIIELGGVHYIFEASRKVSEQKDLCVPTLREIAKKTLTDYYMRDFSPVNQNNNSQRQHNWQDGNIEALHEEGYIKSANEYRRNLVTRLESVVLSQMTKDEFHAVKPCKECYKACYHKYVREYRISRSRHSTCYPLCSVACASKDPNFLSRPFFAYIGREEIE